MNGIETQGKTLDQVTDMMVANSVNLIITVKPANQRNTLSGKRNTRTAAMYSVDNSITENAGSPLSSDDEDEVTDLTQGAMALAVNDARTTRGNPPAAVNGTEHMDHPHNQVDPHSLHTRHQQQGSIVSDNNVCTL